MEFRKSTVSLELKELQKRYAYRWKAETLKEEGQGEKISNLNACINSSGEMTVACKISLHLDLFWLKY